MSDEQPIGKTIEQKIRELGEEIREMRRDFDKFKFSFAQIIEQNNKSIKESEELIRRNNKWLRKST